MSNGIQYVVGDATSPIGDGKLKIIAHVCNDVRAWGAGFVLSISKKWPHVEEAFRLRSMNLGDVDFICADEGTIVANMCAQRDIAWRGGVPPIRYDALRRCLGEVRRFVYTLLPDYGHKVSVHMPRIGCGLAGGTWDKVEPIVKEQLVYSRVPVYVYDLPGRRVKDSI